MEPCIEGRTNHSYRGSSECIFCHSVNPGFGGDGKSDALGQPGASVTTETAGTASPVLRARLTKRINPEEQARVKIQREAISRLIATLPHSAQKSIAYFLYQYTGDAFSLASDDEKRLAGCWLQVMDAFNYDPASPYVAVAVLVITEIEISMKQWKEMFDDVARSTLERR